MYKKSIILSATVFLIIGCLFVVSCIGKGGKKEGNKIEGVNKEQYPGYKTITWSEVPECDTIPVTGPQLIGTGSWLSPALGKLPCQGPIKVSEGQPTVCTITVLGDDWDGFARYEAKVPPGCKLKPQLVFMNTKLVIAPGSVLFLDLSQPK